jgi:hypothetical protein
MARSLFLEKKQRDREPVTEFDISIDVALKILVNSQGSYN